MSDLEVAYKQKIYKLEKENKLLRMKCLRMAEENKALQEDNAELQEKVLDREACR